MNLKEYKVQLALGTIDYRKTARDTRSNAVLQDIIGRTNDFGVLSAVVLNSKANILTLTLLVSVPTGFCLEESLITSCVYHPNVILSVLERWMKNYPAIKSIKAVRQRVRALQLASGVSEENALDVDEVEPTKKTITTTGTGPPYTSPTQVPQTWGHWTNNNKDSTWVQYIAGS